MMEGKGERRDWESSGKGDGADGRILRGSEGERSCAEGTSECRHGHACGVTMVLGCSCCEVTASGLVLEATAVEVEFEAIVRTHEYRFQRSCIPGLLDSVEHTEDLGP